MFEKLFAWIRAGVSKAVAEGMEQGVRDGISRVSGPRVLDVESSEPGLLPAATNGSAKRKPAMSR